MRILTILVTLITLAGCSTIKTYGLAPLGYLIDKQCQEANLIASGTELLIDKASEYHTLTVNCYAKGGRPDE